MAFHNNKTINDWLPLAIIIIIGYILSTAVKRKQTHTKWPSVAACFDFSVEAKQRIMRTSKRTFLCTATCSIFEKDNRDVKNLECKCTCVHTYSDLSNSDLY